MQIGKIGIITKTYRHAKRYRQVLTVLFRYGFGELVDRLAVGEYLEIGMQMISRKPREQVERLSPSERIRMVLEELGPTTVKLGQILSSRPDLVPVEIATELSKLQDKVPPFEAGKAKMIVEEELGASLEELFDRFDEEPLAAASIGQIHRARVKGGDDVAVKVQRPDIRASVEVDCEILLHLATLMERHVEDLAFYRPTRIIGEFTAILEKELDYTREAANAERFARQFISDPAIYVPRIYRDLTTVRVLTMEFVDGIKASDVEALDRAGCDRKMIASRGGDLLLQQVFEKGFFHADPHPGNVFILPGNAVCYLDFGMMGTVDRQTREDFADLAFAVFSKDEMKMVSAFMKVLEWEEEPDRRALEQEMVSLREMYLYKPLKEIRFGEIFPQLLNLVSRFRLRLPPDRFLMMKVLSQAECLGNMLDPEFDMTAKAAPYIKRLKMERLHPRRLAEEMLDTGSEVVQLLREIPGEVREIARQVRQGRASMGLEHKGLEKLIFELDRSSNRIAFAMIIASIIIGSSLIIQTDTGPFFLGFPLLGVVGFCLAGLFGLRLVTAIIRSGKL